jgi:PAS domain S-box-containing protein
MNSIKKPTYEALQNLVDKLKVDAKVKNNKALLKSDVLYQDILNSSKDLIVVVNKNGKIEFINHASKKFYGLSPGKCLGKIVFDFVHPEDQEKIKAKFIKWQHLKKNTFHFENRQMSSSGEIRETEWNVNIERNEKKNN